MKIPVLLALAASLALAAPAAAQAPARPELPRGADTNDWQSYFDRGEQQWQRLPLDAYASFYWASRLDPTRSEPLMAMWATFFARDDDMLVGYLNGERDVLRRADVAANEALLSRAHLRNPFVHRGMEVAMYLRLGDRLLWGQAMNAFVAYGRGDFPGAARRFGQIIRSDPRRNVRFRHYRALSFVSGGQVDSATVEIELLLERLRQQDELRVVYFYESKATWEYALGLLYEAQGRAGDAREAFQRALVEDLTMHPAYAALARLELRDGNPAEALVHAKSAAEIAPGDAVMQFEHANALAAAGHLDQAVQAYRRATQLEPYWADPTCAWGP